MTRSAYLAIASIYFASGLCSLIHEVVWVRLLKLSLGNTVQAASIVVSTFLGGLALGSWIAARFADRVRAPLRAFAVVELLVAGGASLMPVLLGFADQLYRWWYRTGQPSPAGLRLVQLMVSAGLLLGPTVLMGMTLPLLARAVAGRGASIDDPAVGRRVGTLYAVNTFGAAVGCFLAGFVLFRVLGVPSTLYGAAALNAVVALAAWRAAWRARASPAEAVETCPPEAAGGPARGIAGVRFGLVLPACFVIGTVSIGYEVLWIRSIIAFVGTTTYVFSAVLTVYLLGSMLGAAAASWIAGTRLPAVHSLAAVLFLIGAAGLVYVPMLSLGPWIHDAVLEPCVRGLGRWAGRQVTYPLAACAVFFLPPSVILGAGFPLALRAWHERRRRIGASAGQACAASTAGSVAGGLAAGFVLIPFLGVQAAMTVLGLAAAWTGSLLLSACGPRAAIAALLFLGASIAGVVATPSDLFLRCFRDKLRTQYGAEEVRYVKEGITTTVSVHTEPGGSTHLCASGMHLASDEFGQSAWQKFHGYSGPMLHGRAGSALCIGYGSGESAACLVRYGLQRVDCVEISPEVVETAARFFGHINAGVRPGERARIILMDGRNYLHLTGETYDLILSDPINPLFAENAALYTEEFFRSARDRLRPQGLFLCWLPVYLPEDAFESILATAARAFAHVTLWAVPGSNDAFLQVVCSRDPQRFSPARVGAAFSARPVASDLARLGIDSGHAFLAYYRGDERGVRKYAKRARINSDRMPVVEFTTRPMLTGLRARVLVSRLLRTTHDYSLGEHLDWQGFSDDERRQWQSEFELRQRAQSRHAAWPRQPSAP